MTFHNHPNVLKLLRLNGAGKSTVFILFISTFHCAFCLLSLVRFIFFVLIFWYFNCQMKQNENLHSLLWAIWLRHTIAFYLQRGYAIVRGTAIAFSQHE